MKRNFFLLLTVVFIGELIAFKATAQSAQTDTLLQTPYGLVLSSHVHTVDNKTIVKLNSGHLQMIDMTTGKVKRDLGVPSKEDMSAVNPYTYAAKLTSKVGAQRIIVNPAKNIRGESSSVKPVGSGGKGAIASAAVNNSLAIAAPGTSTYASQFQSGPAGNNIPNNLISDQQGNIQSFATTWVVPRKALDSINTVTTFLWNGLDGGAIQPVMQWDEGYGYNYSIANWYFINGNYFHGTFVPVNPGDTLVATVTYLSNTDDTSWTYKETFAGYPQADVTLTRPTEATDPVLAWEAYTQVLSQWPNQAYIALKNIHLTLRTGTPPDTLHWQGGDGAGNITPSGKNMVVVNNSSSNGEVDLYFGDGTGITPDSAFQVISATNGYALNAPTLGNGNIIGTLGDTSSKSQLWQISNAATNGYYMLKPLSAIGNVLNVPSPSVGTQANTVSNSNTAGQQWKVTPLANGYCIISPLSDTTLNLNYNSNSSITLAAGDATKNTQWFKFVYAPQTQPLPTAHAIWHVDSEATGANNGKSWMDAFTTVSAALSAANDNDQIWVAQGTYQPASNSYFNVAKHVSLYGGFTGTETDLSQRSYAGHPTILKGNGSSVVNYAGGQTNSDVLDGFVITGGTGQNLGAIAGGGVFIQNAAPTIRNSAFINNGGSGVTYGGALFLFGSSAGSTLVENSVFINNTAGAGYGGIVVTYGNGGDITAKLVNCTSLNNGTVAIFPVSGGSSSVTVSNSVIYEPSGYAFYGYAAPVIYDHNYIAGNTASTLTDNGGNIISTANPFVNSANPAGADGILGTADDGLYLTDTSAAVDAGSNAAFDSTITFDFGGQSRIVNDTIDMGAYETQSTNSTPVTLINFNGSLQNGVATLNWKSGVESNFKQYEVETSSDGKTFATAGTVTAKGSNSSYTFSRAQSAAKAYYRLKMVDNDGTFKYSNILGLSQNSGTGVSLYPVPATDLISIKIPAATILKIYNATGHLVKMQQLQAGVNTIYISNLSNGIYYALVNGQKVKFIKE